MNSSPEELALNERFEKFYARSQSPALLSIERSVCGCAYGGNSWTTRSEAEQMAEDMGLRPGERLLDLGAGTGWPGLYMAKSSGCDVVLADLPLVGLQIAAERAVSDGMSGQVTTIVADAAEMPFPDNSFDAISHSDLLCCLKKKKSVLAACRRVIRHRGRMVFTVISIAPDLSSAQYTRAVANGPDFIETDSEYPELLAETGWSISHQEDITEAFSASYRRQIDADLKHKDDLHEIIGNEEFEQRLAEWRSKCDAVDDHLVRRELYYVEPKSG